jgi:hypothetical protein
MNAANGHANGLEHGQAEAVVAPAALLHASAPSQFSPEKIKVLVAELEVPFVPSVIEWRVTNATKDKTRGQIIPYADQRAYTDRLNGLFTPAGWTRRYSVHTSPNFQRNKDQKTVAKVFVTCELTIFGIGSHSATGEEWADDENACTSAEAQAFKRACSCFGLGRYLYYFTGVWVDLDAHKRPKVMPKLFGWATPKGWRDGLRPSREADLQAANPEKPTGAAAAQSNRRKDAPNHNQQLLRQIEAMEKPLGKGLYRGLLKTVARAWKPSDIRDAALLQKLLTHMQSADRGLQRLQSILGRIGPDALGPVLSSLQLKSLDQIDNLNTLQRIVLALEAKAASPPKRS